MKSNVKLLLPCNTYARLTPGFFTYYLLIIYMKTPLALRPLNVRLNVAYMAQAWMNYSTCLPGNTFTRAYSSVKEDGTHPYISMWHSIGKCYDAMDLGELSDDEINEKYSVAIRLGLKVGTKDIPAEQFRQAKLIWHKRGWKRYETRRNSRHFVANKAIVVTALLCVGVFDINSVTA